jgi:nucleoside-diphosphate-sugar epimerase
MTRYLTIYTLLFHEFAASFELFVYGLGNVGLEVSRMLSRSEWIVHGTTRRSNLELDQYNVPPADIPAYLGKATHILITIPATSDISMTVLSQVTENISEKCRWVGFVSTTGVYGNHEGAWVTEESELLSNSHSTLSYIEYENMLSSLFKDIPLAIFRCSGLYGKTRSALHTVWNDGCQHLVTTSDCYPTNRIHEHDVARAILSSMQHIRGGIFNLSDDEPELRSLVRQYAHSLLHEQGISLPDMLVKQDSTTERVSRRKSDWKLVNNSKMKETLIEKLVFPSYREGLNSIMLDRSNPWWS